MSSTDADHQACGNTDRELWREREGDYYADSIHVTEQGGIGINCGGHVIVKPLREWHRLAQSATERRKDYEAKNPLGGPARMFEAIASRIRAGEDYYEVLADYDLCVRSEKQHSARNDWPFKAIGFVDRGVVRWEPGAEPSKLTDGALLYIVHDGDRAKREGQ